MVQLRVIKNTHILSLNSDDPTPHEGLMSLGVYLCLSGARARFVYMNVIRVSNSFSSIDLSFVDVYTCAKVK